VSIKLDYTNMLNVPKTKVNISEKDIEALKPQVKETISQLNNDQGDNKDKDVIMTGWQDAPLTTDDKVLDEITAAAQDLKSKTEAVYVIGIGGSYLGPRAVIEAIFGKNYNDFISPKIYFIGCNTDPEEISRYLALGKDKKTGAIVISKSGTTTEPGIAFRLVKSMIEKQQSSQAKDYIIAVTDKEKGALRKLADAEGYKTFIIPDNIGGRFSVITPVGLVPIALSGVNIKEYVSGFKTMKKTADSPEVEKNPVAMLALLRFLAIQKGAVAEYQVTNSSSFESNILWTMQLEPESEGHQGHGIHVIPAQFPRDLHSIGQLIQQGPRNLIEVGTQIEKVNSDLQVPNDKNNLDGLNYIKENGYSLNDINQMALEGPFTAHYADGVPNMTIILPEITPNYLGQYHYMLEKATAISGYLMQHNPFIQPGVQFWKDKLFTMAGKPGYEEEHKTYLAEKGKVEKKII